MVVPARAALGVMPVIDVYPTLLAGMAGPPAPIDPEIEPPASQGGGDGAPKTHLGRKTKVFY